MYDTPTCKSHFRLSEIVFRFLNRHHEKDDANILTRQKVGNT